MSWPIVLFYGFSFLGLVHTVIFSYLALKNRRTADLIITLFLFVQSLIILEYVFYWTGLENPYHYLCNISLTLQLLFGPLLLIYVDLVFSEKKKLINYAIHFLPAIIILVFMLPYYLSTADLKTHHSKMIKYFVLDLRYVVYFIMVHMSAYCIFLIVKIIKEKRIGHIKNWLLLITGIFGFYIACYISYFIMVRQPWFTLSTDYFVSIGMCASIISIIYLAYGKSKILEGYPVKDSVKLENFYLTYKENPSDTLSKKKESIHQYKYPEESVTERQINILTQAEPDKEYQQKYKNSGLSGDVIEELAKAMDQLMQQEMLYRESELKLETLAQKLGVARHYVSQVINQHYGINFFEYINHLRIKEAQQILINPANQSMNIIEVAYEVGFNTKNTFNAAFRRITGITPTAFRNQNKTRLN